MPDTVTATPPPTRRRFVKLSLRLAMLVIALLAVWLAWLTNRARMQEQVVRELQAKGYTFAFDYEYPPGGSITAASKLRNAQAWAPAWLRRWVGKEYFRRLVVAFWDGNKPRPIPAGAREPRKDDEFLRKLAARGGLRQLTLFELEIRGETLAECAPTLGKLEALSLSACPNVDDSLLSFIARLPKLQALSIQGCPITGRHFEAIGSRLALQKLSLFSGTMSSEGVKQLRGLRNLNRLALQSSLITDESLAELHFPKLTFLFLSSPRVTGASFKSIGRMTGLKELYLDCGASDEAVAALRPLNQLTKLAIWPTGETLTDRALEALKAFPKLNRLAIGNTDHSATHFSDQDLIDLVRALPALRTLELEGQYLDHQAILDLKQERPGLRITRPQ